MKGREDVAKGIYREHVSCRLELKGTGIYLNEVCFRQGVHAVLYVKL